MGRDRLIQRATAKGWTLDKLDAKIKRRERIKAVARNVVSPVLRPVLEAAADAIPGGTIALGLISQVADAVTGERAVPVLADIGVVGGEMWRARVREFGGDPIRAALSDLVPLREAIEERDWPRAVAGLALLIGGAVAVLLA
ncbi:MAG: hypothetical protein D6744_10785 [Planctomycetota bacterium]|nr:MAG: hypothetical protein D6744_10785 [Planctomycetota bacterium]